jgi:hypothetical protein
VISLFGAMMLAYAGLIIVLIAAAQALVGPLRSSSVEPLVGTIRRTFVCAQRPGAAFMRHLGEDHATILCLWR